MFIMSAMLFGVVDRSLSGDRESLRHLYIVDNRYEVYTSLKWLLFYVSPNIKIYQQ